METEAQWEDICAFSYSSQVTVALCGFFLCLWAFALKGCLGPAQNCMHSCCREERHPAIKQCVKQVNKMLQGTQLLEKMPKMFLPQWDLCLVPWVCFPPVLLVLSSKVDNRWALSLYTNQFLIGHLSSAWIMTMWNNFEFSGCFILFSWCCRSICGELVAWNTTVLL